MQIKVIKAATMKEALERVKTELGPNAAILQTRKYKSGGVMGIGGKEEIEVTAAIDDEEPPAKPEPKAEPPKPPQPTFQQIPKPQPKPAVQAARPKQQIQTPTQAPPQVQTPPPTQTPPPQNQADNYFAGPIVEDEDEDEDEFVAETQPPQPQPPAQPVVETQPTPKPRPKISIKVPPKIQIPGQKPPAQTQTPKPIQPIKPQLPKPTEIPKPEIESKTESQVESKTESQIEDKKPATIAPKKFTIPTKIPKPIEQTPKPSEEKTELPKPEVESKSEENVESIPESNVESKEKSGLKMSETPSDFDLIKDIKPLDESDEDLEHPEEVAKIEQTDDSKSESKAESKTESKVEEKSESKPEEEKIESKSEEKVESKPVEEKIESKTESKVEEKSESKTEEKVEEKIEIKPEPLEKEFIGMPLPRFQQLKRLLPPKTPKSIGALPAINVKVISNDPVPEPKLEPKPELPKIEPAKIAPAKIESKVEEKSSENKIQEIPTMPRDEENPEPKIETPISAEQKRIQELEKELADMKDLLKKFTNDHDIPRKENLTLHDVLQSQEIDENLIKEMTERSRQGVMLEDNRSDNAKQALSTFIGQIMDFSQGIKLNRNGVRIAALIGPTGVGKTTTLAKIAAKFVLEKNAKTALITADTYRISAVEQIKTYSDILGLPLEIVYSPMELARAIRRHSDKHLILIDTAGRSHFNRDQMRELQDFLKISPYIERHLVVSATTKKRDANDIIERFSVCNPNRLVLTKTDETSSTGALLDLLREKNIPLSYITHGQSVPDDILPASPDSMADVLLNRINDDAFDTEYHF